jgi:hypothetical protein
MEDLNAYFRRINTQHVPTTDGIPDYYLLTVRMFRAAFPNGLPIDSADYTAACVFLDHEEYPHRAIAQILDFSFDLGYVDVLNALGFIEDNQARAREIARVEALLRPHGLDEWRREDEYGRPPDTFAASIRAIESDLGVRYPPSAAHLFSALSAIVGTSQHHGVFERGRLLASSAEVAAVQDDLGGRLIDGYLLPFLQVEQTQSPHVYGYDLADPMRNRIAVYSVHTIVHDWPNEEAFLHWIRSLKSA